MKKWDSLHNATYILQNTAYPWHGVIQKVD